MKTAPFLLGLAIAISGLLGAHGAPGPGCGPETSRVFEVGRDEAGYFVRSKPWDGDVRVPSRVTVSIVGDFLARAAGATAFYFGNSHTENPLETNEWRSENRLVLLKAFCRAAGLDVETPQPGFWIIGPPWIKQHSALSVSAQPLDPTGQGFLSAAQAGDMERALIAQLPIREGHGTPEVSRVDISYYWLPKEGRDMLLVLATLSPELEHRPPSYTAFKVRLERSGAGTKVECLWASEAPGPLLTGIDEDFDGDGYRDFVFVADTIDYGDVTTVLSGKDGSALFTISDSDLAVEKRAAGPKRVAVRAGDMAQVYQYSAEQESFVPVPEPRLQAQALEAEGAAGINAGWKHLAQLAGGAQNVRLYLLYRAPDQLRLSAEVEHILAPRRSDWAWKVTQELIDKGYPARIVYSWESEGFKEARERHESKIRKLSGLAASFDALLCFRQRRRA